MALRGVKPKAVQKRFKALFFGPAGVGKTTTAIQFPSPYLIDTERGAENRQYAEALEKAGGLYFFTPDFDEVLAEVRALLTERHKYRTLIIDPLTIVYNELCDRSAKELADKSRDPNADGTEFGRHKALADRKMKRLLNLLLRLDMNVIVTSHSKVKWEKVGDSFKDAGNTFDCYAKLDYLFDLVIEAQKRGQERVAIVRKSRIETFPESGEAFPFTYDEIAERYGREILERQAAVEDLASADQVKTIAHLVSVLKIEQDVVDKWFDKAQADSFDELPRSTAAKIIEWLQAKLAPATEPAAAEVAS